MLYNIIVFHSSTDVDIELELLEEGLSSSDEEAPPPRMPLARPAIYKRHVAIMIMCCTLIKLGGGGGGSSFRFAAGTREEHLYGRLRLVSRQWRFKS